MSDSDRPVPEPALHSAQLGPELAGLERAPQWYVGYSGGLDSTVLLHLLQQWRAANPDSPPLTALHVNHCLQADADAWQAHCEQLCRALGVAFISRVEAVRAGGQGIEAAARAVRYGIFERQLEPAAVLFLGHHLDDQIETFFLRLMRGAGLQGLAAMPARRSLGRGLLARPLLRRPRSQLEDYAREHRLRWVEDPSNTDTAMDRNFLRHQLLPVLASRWPAYRRTVARAGDHLAAAAALLQELSPAPATVRNALGDPGLAVADLLQGSLQLAAQRLRTWLQTMGLPAPGRTALDEFLRQVRQSSSAAGPRLVCSAFTLRRYRDALYLLPAATPPPAVFPRQLRPGQRIAVAGVGSVGLVPAAGQGLLLAADEPLDLVWRSGGERCRPRGRAHANTLKKLLQDAGVPPWWRDRVPLLYLDGELLAVGDLWLCESSRWRESAPKGQTLWRPTWDRNMACSGD